MPSESFPFLPFLLLYSLSLDSGVSVRMHLMRARRIFWQLAWSLEVRNWASGCSFSSSPFWKTRHFVMAQTQKWDVWEPSFFCDETLWEDARKNYCRAITWLQRTEISITICGHGFYSIQTVSLTYSDNDIWDNVSLSFLLIIHCPLCCTVAGQLSLTDVFETWVA